MTDISLKDSLRDNPTVVRSVEQLRDLMERKDPVWLVGVGRGGQWVRIDYVESLTIGFSAFGDAETWCFRTEQFGETVFCLHPTC